jgi:hypothetical protein
MGISSTGSGGNSLFGISGEMGFPAIVIAGSGGRGEGVQKRILAANRRIRRERKEPPRIHGHLLRPLFDGGGCLKKGAPLVSFDRSC